MIIDQLPLLSGDAQTTDELPLERGTTTYKATLPQILSSKQDRIIANGILIGDGSAVSAATLGTDYGALSFAVTLTTAGWINNVQTVSNSNFVTSGYAYIVSPASGSFAAYAEAVIYADDVTVAGSMTFHCENVPSSALTVNIVRMVSA